MTGRPVGEGARMADAASCAPGTPPTFLVFGKSGWSRMVLPWHVLSRRLAREHRVVFVRDPQRRFPRTAPRLETMPGGVVDVAPVDYPLQRFPAMRSRGLRRAKLAVLEALAGAPRPWVVLLFPRCWLELALSVDPDLVAYVVTDDFSVKDDGLETPDTQYLEWEERALACSRLVLPVADTITRRLSSLTGSPVVTFPLSYDEEVMTGTTTRPSPVLRDLARPVLGFAGTVRLPRIDVDLVRGAAGLRPDWTFAFVGPVIEGPRGRKSDFDGVPNVRFLDIDSSVDLPGLVGGFDVIIAPYRDEHVNRGYYPLKVLDGLAMGRPGVVTPRSDLTELAPHILFASDSATFVGAVEGQLRARNDGAAVRDRRSAVSHRRYSERISQLEDLCAQALAGTTPRETVP